jgi:hypothetical protein
MVDNMVEQPMAAFDAVIIVSLSRSLRAYRSAKRLYFSGCARCVCHMRSVPRGQCCGHVERLGTNGRTGRKVNSLHSTNKQRTLVAALKHVGDCTYRGYFASRYRKR